MKINIKRSKIVFESAEINLIETPVYDRHDDGETNFARILPLTREGKIYAYRITVLRSGEIFDKFFHLWEISDGSSCHVAGRDYLPILVGRKNYDVEKEQFDNYLQELIASLTLTEV